MWIQNFLKSPTSTPTKRRPIRRSSHASRLKLQVLEDRTVPSYSVINLGTLGGSFSETSDINSTTQVVGWAGLANGDEHAFLWQNGVMTDLGTLGGNLSRAWGINDSGQVVGFSGLAGGTIAYRAFLLTPEDTDGNGTPDRWFRDSNADGANDLMRNLGTLGGSNPDSRATDVNNLGQVAGYSSSWSSQGGGVSRAFLWQNGVMSDLGALGGNQSYAHAINDAGQITGGFSTTLGNTHTFLRTNGVMTDLGLSSGANNINSSGQLVDSYSGSPRLWTPAVPNGSTGTFTHLGFLPPIWPESGRYESTPLGINSTSEVVGYQHDVFYGEESSGMVDRGFRSANGVIEELPVQTAVAINDAGQIAGNTDGGAFLLTQIPLDLPLVSISGATVTEGNSGTTEAVFTVELSEPSDEPATVQFATQDDSAIAGSDYQAMFGTLTFAPGQTRQTISVAVFGDRIGEGNESFTVALSSPTGAILLNGSATGFIYDDEPRIAGNSVEVVEGNSGTVTTFVTLSLSNAYDQDVTVNYITQDLSAIAGSDYVPVSGMLTFAPGGPLTQQVAVTVVSDRVFEGSWEGLLLVGYSPSSNATVGASGYVKIWDDEPFISISPEVVTIAEGDAGTTDAVFTVSLSAAYDEDVTVDYATSDDGGYYDSAVAGSDYLATAGTVRIPAGQTSQTIRVPVIGDQMAEPDEYFYVGLSNPSINAALNSDYAVGVILNDEPPEISIYDVATSEGNAGTTSVTFSVGLSMPSGQTISVHYATVNGSATAGGDYQSASGTLTFAPDETSKTFTVQIIGDRLIEPNETFVVNLSSPMNATIADGQGVGTILDDEPRISISDVTKAEGKKGQTTLFTFTVTLSAAYDQAVTMSFRTVNGTATTSDGDYIAKTGTLTFAPGETTKTITIEVKGDSRKESNEMFYLELFGASGNAMLLDAVGLGTILNDD